MAMWAKLAALLRHCPHSDSWRSVSSGSEGLCISFTHHFCSKSPSAATWILALEAVGRLHPEWHLVPLRAQLVRVVTVPV